MIKRPIASPSAPSIQFIALITATIQKIVMKKLIKEFNSKLEKLLLIKLISRAFILKF